MYQSYSVSLQTPIQLTGHKWDRQGTSSPMDELEMVSVQALADTESDASAAPEPLQQRSLRKRKNTPISKVSHKLTCVRVCARVCLYAWMCRRVRN